ncbi:MAG: 2-hydroxyacyl-CoA dehydratase [Clostridia bacterium]|nr:2-hydroxyacyl-CoA dehydratase [Clostridia bacterium]
MAVHPNAARPSSPASPVTPAVPASGIPPVSPRSEPAARPVKADLPVLSLGADVGSTTAKIAVLRGDEILYTSYERHYSRIRETLVKMLRDAAPVLGDSPFTAAVSGSAGLGLAEGAGIPFVQEVWATGEVVKTLEHDVSCVIELGGEDAKIIFFKGGADERMNGTCAGGTGAFIDQMASLLDVTPDELDELALNHKKIYPIASRCGVFAKSDVQPLLNQGASREDIAASVYQAVVNQTVAGLAQGRKIEGRVLFLGGPLSFCRGLRDRFVETLGLKEEEAVFPPYARNAVSLGAALYSRRIMTSDPNCLFTLDALADKIENAKIRATSSRTDPLFRNREEYEEFSARHAKASVPAAPIEEYEGGASLGIDCGSTTTKLALVGEGGELLYTYYAPNRGNPVGIVRQELSSIYALCGDRVKIRASAVTGYGEDLIRHAFGVDYGVVETVAHYTAAKHFLPDVDFILDIGGQDIKCFRIRAGAVDKIMLNEACSSGCGSFIETFARSMHLTAAEFAQRALFASAPVNLGSRCTVFMNSQVKQSQKDGATVEDISAGLSLSVVKNAIYKVIRAHSPDELGERIVVQGGTFFNDAVLRAFEREIGREVIRPNIAGLMGAYGAALYAADRKDKEEGQNAGTPEKPASKLISPSALASFTHQSRTATCGGCENRCLLTVNTFPGGRKFISGNKCERGAGQTHVSEDVPNLHAFKRGLLLAEAPQTLPPASETGPRGTVGLPLCLGMYELLPLWTAVFRSLGFTPVLSGMSSKEIYELGQFSIPSDTACYPAKIMHGHIEKLVGMGVDAVFYPRMTWNLDEHASDNHYNCPVVAYYSELLRGNMDCLKKVRFLYPYLSVDSESELAEGLRRALTPIWPDIKKAEIKKAVSAGFANLAKYTSAVKAEGERAVGWARENGKKVMILAGRPYHADAEIGHGIDKLAVSLGFAVVSEDSIYHLAKTPEDVRVLNQWTYHSRLYRAAAWAAENPDAQLVQLVSFGCGVDAITTDEVKRILENAGKYYTQIKIDEIANLGAVKIRLRSLAAVL